MTRRKIAFLVLSGLLYLPIVYLLFVDPFGAKMYDHLLLLFLIPLAGTVLWFWALYDWGTRSFRKWARLTWLIVLIITMYLGATIYFLAVGLRERRKALNQDLEKVQ